VDLPIGQANPVSKAKVVVAAATAAAAVVVAAANDQQRQHSTHVCFGSLTDISHYGFYVRFTPKSRRKTPKNGHRRFNVRFTPESGRNLNARSCPLLAINGHRRSFHFLPENRVR
jgi:hypothetical protein